jgi:hypothetical protein
VAAVAAAGCGSASSSPASSLSPSPPTTTQAPPAAAPDTAAAARSAAQAFFGLYAAQQYTAVYPMLDAQARAELPEHKWVAVHEDCPPEAVGLSYKVGAPVMAGQTAVMAVSLSGAASAIGSEEESFVYQDGGWFWAPSALDLAGYKGTVAQIVAARKAAGECGNAG